MNRQLHEMLFREFVKYALTALTNHLHSISMKIEIASHQLASLGNPIRLKLYRALVRAGRDGLPCGVLQEKLDIAASTLSHHIKHLMEAGLIRQERQGTTLFCQANYPAMHALVGYLVEACCADQRCKP
ncbi:ArsR/SmtB family transcription factor [Dongia sp.]|uniref:ArsR/SmtB family transcription factor n=1 Tax=Dongia sp. TaxID=1977262 RepID=UPI0035AE4D9A